MFSDTPGRPGRSAHTPRTISSIFTPAREARYSASIDWGSTSAFILAMTRAGRPARACSASRASFWSTISCMPNGDCVRRLSCGVWVRLVSCRNSSCTSWPISSSQVKRP